jgi:hypothetical protein
MSITKCLTSCCSKKENKKWFDYISWTIRNEIAVAVYEIFYIDGASDIKEIEDMIEKFISYLFKKYEIRQSYICNNATSDSCASKYDEFEIVII